MPANCTGDFFTVENRKYYYCIKTNKAFLTTDLEDGQKCPRCLRTIMSKSYGELKPHTYTSTTVYVVIPERSKGPSRTVSIKTTTVRPV